MRSAEVRSEIEPRQLPGDDQRDVQTPIPSRRGVAVRLFLTCWLVFALHFATNTVREIYPALSLADHLSFDVSEYLGLHPDIFALPGRGAYIDNNPGASILGAVPYALLRPVVDRVVERERQLRAASHQPPPDYSSIYPMAREFYRNAYERGLDVKFGLAAAIMATLLMAPLSALSAVVMFYIFGCLTSTRAALWLSLLYAFATPVFYRTAQLNQNLLVSHCALFAFALLWRPWDNPRAPRRPGYLLAGLLAGWAVVLDYSGVVVAISLGIYALVRQRSLPAAERSWLDLPRFAVGALMSLSVLLGYQWLAFGNPFLPAQRYMPATIYSGYGFNGMGLPQLDLLWDTTFGPRFGLFTSAPILFLAFGAPLWLRERWRVLGRREIWFIVGFTLAFFLFASANQYGRLQFNSGVRYVVPVTPFLFLLVAGTLRKLPRKLAIALGIIATYWSWCLAMYRDVEQGAGILESVTHVTFEGPRLPWVVTLAQLGYVPSAVAVSTAFLVIAAVLIVALWSVPARIGKGET
ncbi:MAG TPA: hypothetical protein VFZ25_20300 [Chloroflexota bacterium]|nr:hypothetical protein [Chloroflexota bacterium]